MLQLIRAVMEHTQTRMAMQGFRVSSFGLVVTVVEGSEASGRISPETQNSKPSLEVDHHTCSISSARTIKESSEHRALLRLVLGHINTTRIEMVREIEYPYSQSELSVSP